MNRVAIIGISSLLLVAMVIGVALTLTGHETTNRSEGRSYGEISETAKAVQTICQPTDFKETCQNTLTSAAGDSTDPKDLIKVSFDIVIQHVGVALNKMEILRETEADPLTHAAYESCKELLEDSVDDLHQTVDSFDAFDVANLDDYLADVKTWLSGALTFQGTCLDGFENTTGDAGEKMKQLLKISGELTRNGLAMIDEFSKTLTAFNITEIVGARKLLSSDEMLIPTWVDSGKRALLDQATDVLNGTLKPDVTVAKDDSGDCKTKVPDKNKKPFVILVKAGVYKEYVEVTKNMSYVVLLGEGPTKTRITGDKNIVDGIPTFKTSTFSVQANHFFAKGIGFENTAGASKHQAVAARVSSDMAIFYQCIFDGYQDTLYAHAHRQFYRNCTISGTIDFIFGDASAIFQQCTMIVKKPLENQACMVTAQGRDERRENTGLVLQNCTIVPSPELKASVQPEPVKVYLGRPWKIFSRTVIMNSNIDGFVAPEGWSPWAGNFGLDSSFYAELGNTGAGAELSKRVTWGGIKKINFQEADEFSARRFINGDLWVKPTGIPYDSTIDEGRIL